MRGINHPGVVQLLSFFESDEYYFLVLERASWCPNSYAWC